MDKIKSFVAKHDTEIIYGTALVVLGAATLVSRKRLIANLRVVDVGDKIEDGMHIIQVVYGDGCWETWTRPVEA